MSLDGQRRQSLAAAASKNDLMTPFPKCRINQSHQCCLSQNGARSSASEIQHTNYLIERIGSLFMNESFSDIVLIVEDSHFAAHKLVLASGSEYFRALLFGEMRESTQREIELKDTNAAAFKILLQYMYTGRMFLSELSEDRVLDALSLSHKYGFVELESSIAEYLKMLLDAENLWKILSSAQLYGLKELSEFCLQFADRNAYAILCAETFAELPSAFLTQLISRDSFCADEFDIFLALQKWAKHSQNNREGWNSVVGHLRLSLIRLDELLKVVRPSGLVSLDALMDAISEQNEKKAFIDLGYRAYRSPDVNVATAQLNAQVIKGESKEVLLNGDSTNYYENSGFTWHQIKDGSEGIIMQLGAPCIINHIRLLLWDKEEHSYSYYVEVSVDKRDWTKIVDYGQFLCRSWQKLYFPARAVKYIRLVGVHCTANSDFQVVNIEAMFSTDDQFSLRDQILVPETNVATVDLGACVIQGIIPKNGLIMGSVRKSNYTACHKIGEGSIVIQLAQPYWIYSLALLLWDHNNSSYSYYIESSVDQKKWNLIVDKRNEACKLWQYLQFEPTVATFFRITGTHSTVNDGLYCVHFACPADSSEINESRLTPKKSTDPGGRIIQKWPTWSRKIDSS